MDNSILILEDEKNLGSTLSERLSVEGFQSMWAKSVHEAQGYIRTLKFDLALLDVGLGDGSGFDIALELRDLQPETAVIFLTAWGNPEDRIRGLELGAEDYIVKPFHLKELILRIRNGLRRATYLKSSVSLSGIYIGKACVRFARFEIEMDGRIQRLSHKEAALLRLLVERRGSVVSRDEMLDQAWSKDEFPTPRTVDNFIMRLRRLLEPDPEHPEFIRSIRGIGYQLI